MGVSFVKEEPRNCSDCFGFPFKTKEGYPKKEEKPMKERVGAEGEGGVDGAGGGGMAKVRSAELALRQEAAD